MNSVLLIGNNSFVTSVVGQVRGLDSLTVQLAATASDAAKLIEASRPDVVVAQSRTLVQGSIYRTFVQEFHSLYFLVIEDRSLEALYPKALGLEEIGAENRISENRIPENRSSENRSSENRSSENPGLKEFGLDSFYHDYDSPDTFGQTAPDTFGQTALSAHHEQFTSERSRQSRKQRHSEVVTQRTPQSAQQMAQPGPPLTADTITPQQLTVLQLERTAIALEAGADAYLWLPLTGTPVGGTSSTHTSSSHASTTHTSGTHNPRTALGNSRQSVSSSPAAAATTTHIGFHQTHCRLIQAHIRLGLNRSQRYRDLSRINDWLSAVALVDALTQLSNRRAFDLELPRQIRAARDKGLHLSLMVVDIDYFKSVNDRYGHLVGDDVLKNLAKRLLANMRFYDTPFRYGGEEFVITLNKTDLVEATTIAERLRESMDQKPFELTHLLGESTLLPVTVSIGLTELHADDDEQGRSLLHRADQNLLLAKGAGRNRVVSQ